MSNLVIPDDGYSDGGVPYTDDELRAMTHYWPICPHCKTDVEIETTFAKVLCPYCGHPFGIIYMDDEPYSVALCKCGHTASEHNASGICTHYPGEVGPTGARTCICLAYAAQ